MAIQIDPILEQDLRDRIARLQVENTQLTDAIQQTQDRISGTAPPPPGLNLEDDVNIDLQTKLDAAVALFETEREALDGVFPSPPVTPTDIEDAANNVRPSTLFPITNFTVTPTFVDPLKGLGGLTASNEDSEKAIELADIVTLLGLLVGARPGDPAFTSWVASLTAQSALLATQITAATANSSYGASHADVIAATAEKAAIDALLPTPPVDDATLNARSAQATTRKAFIPTRVDKLKFDVGSDSEVLYNQRFLVIDSRVNTGKGTRKAILSSEKKIVLFQGFIDLNNDLIAFYNSVLP
jgi:hypothetical protein